MRKEFEKLPEIAEILNKNGGGYYKENTNDYHHCNLYFDKFLNGAWYAWQAKAQVVPKGFVLVSKNKLKMELCSIRDLNNGEHSNSIIEDCVCNVEAMIEAQEQNQ